MRQQKRARRIAMTPAEVDAFLTAERTCRVASSGADGRPHVVPLWFVWDGAALWLSSLVRSQRWTDLARDPRVAVVVDAGEQYDLLRGVEISGTATPVGPVPREDTGPVPELAGPERLFARKYARIDEFTPDGRHAWLRVDPDKITSWDFRKIP
jgi:PPOX class probable F420-dependent enzyme